MVISGTWQGAADSDEPGSAWGRMAGSVGEAEAWMHLGVYFYRAEALRTPESLGIAERSAKELAML